tara:strand:+ start:1387 stop:1806 length:420 start_codon:yes stop_codon:yes gene_type:complete
LFRHLADGHPAVKQIEVGSAGTIALNGNLSCTNPVEVMLPFGLEISGHRARPLSRRLPADRVLPMGRRVERDAKVVRLNAQGEMRGVFVGTGEEVNPYGRSPCRYKAVAEQVHRMVGQVTWWLEPGRPHESDQSHESEA